MATWFVKFVSVSLPAIFSLACATSASAAQVNLVSTAGSATVGSTFQLRLHVDGLTAAINDSLSAFDLGLTFDPTVVSLVGFDFMDTASGSNALDLPEPGGFGFLGDVADLGGSLSAFGLSGNSSAVLDASQSDAFDFLRLTFRADAPSAAALFSLDTTSPFLLFVDSASGLLPVTFGADQVSITINGGGGTVPLPGSATLVSLALLLLGGVSIARRRGLSARRVGAGACLALALSAPALAAGPAPAPAATGAAASGNPAPQGVVLEVIGQRFKLRGADGQVRWYTSTTRLPERIVNKQVTGVPRPVGDTMVMDQLNFQ